MSARECYLIRAGELATTERPANHQLRKRMGWQGNPRTPRMGHKGPLFETQSAVTLRPLSGHRHPLERTGVLRAHESRGRSAKGATPCGKVIRKSRVLACPPPLRDLHAEIDRGRARSGLQLARCAARGCRSLHSEAAARRMDRITRALRRRRLHRRQHGPARSREAAPGSRSRATSIPSWCTRSTA
jgi:hypothetical protein